MFLLKSVAKSKALYMCQEHMVLLIKAFLTTKNTK